MSARVPNLLPKKILVIQTAFIGDVILATALLEKLYQKFPLAQIDFLLRKGNEALFEQHPFLHKVLILNKKEGKYKNQWKILKHIRGQQYDLLINLHRFLSSGLLTVFSGAQRTIGFSKNPLSLFYTEKIPHKIGCSAIHEVARNQQLIAPFTDQNPAYPKLYPPAAAFQKVRRFQQSVYVCLAPASVWFTKQFPASGWVKLIEQLPQGLDIFLLGAPSDWQLCEEIRLKAGKKTVHNLSGKLNLLESAALMQKAQLNYVNDSAPLHLCSAMSAPVCAVFCATVPRFGFGPFNKAFSQIVEYSGNLACRPCGLHGHKNCPQKHFRCAHGIKTEQLLAAYREASRI